MSNRDSLGGKGDLIPQDVVDVFAQERLSKAGRKKKRSKSLGRAFGWLKGKKKKDVGANGQSLGLGPGLDLALDAPPPPAGHKGTQRAGKLAGKQAHPQSNSHGVQKQSDEYKTTVPPLFQENVFIEGSRTKYVEDLHNEAQEGLKLQRQEESNNGVDYRDDESSISTVSVQPEDDDGRGFLSDSTIPDASSTVSTPSIVSSRSSRSGLTRQASTFRPLSSGKKPEKTRRRRHRKTVMGIPQHVQKELGLDRIGWTITRVLDEEQLQNGETVETTDGSRQVVEPGEGATVDPHMAAVLLPPSENQTQQLSSAHTGHRDDLALLQRFAPQLSASARPHSLAVPWMTTANSLQQPPSPVMSMSPQATYLSKIIPNAVLPPAVEVVMISRGRSRSSLRTVSKSSLLLASPASSRASSRASSGRASTLSSASRHRPPMSDSSGWSHSGSSETLVSDSSTISSNSTAHQHQGRSQEGDAEGSSKDGSPKEDKVSLNSSVSQASRATSNGKPKNKVEEVKKDGSFVRSLSVMKSKRAPPPPSRSYSLHNKMKRRSRDLAEARVIVTDSSPQSSSASAGEGEETESGDMKEAGPSPMSSRATDSPGYTADTSSLDDSTGSVSFSPPKTQPQTPETVKTEKPVGENSSSPEKPQPPQVNGLEKTVSPSSGYSSQGGTPTKSSKQTHGSSPKHKKGILAKLQSLFPGSSSAPVVKAPSPLTQPGAPESTNPPEASQPQPDPSSNTATASPSVKALRELFNIPPPPKIHAPPPPPPEVWAHNERTFELLLGPPAPNNTHEIVRKNPKDRRQQRQSPSVSREASVKNLSAERKQESSQIVPVESSNGTPNVSERKSPGSDRLNTEVQKELSERLNRVLKSVEMKGNGKVTEKDEKVNGTSVKVPQKPDLLEATQQETRKTETQTQPAVTGVKTKMDTLAVITLTRVSPSPSPPPAHHPPLPPTKQAIPATTHDAALAPTLEPTLSPTTESSWPPPPPPIVQATDTLVTGHDEMDFPLPPPPLLTEEGLAVIAFVAPAEVPVEQTTPLTSAESTEVSSVKPSEEDSTTCPVVGQDQPVPPTSQGIPPPPQSIPPPPPYSAPDPPAQNLSSSPPAKEVAPPNSQVAAASPESVVSMPQSNPPPPPLERVLSPPQSTPPPPESKLSPPKSNPPPPPPKSKLSLPKSNAPPPPPESVLCPPQSIPPPPDSVISPPQSIPPPRESIISPAQSTPPPPESKLSPPQSSPPPPDSVISPPQSNPPPPPPDSIISPAQSTPPPPESKLSPPQSTPPPPESVLSPPQSIPPPPEPQSNPPPPPPDSIISPAQSTPTPPESKLSPPQSTPPPESVLSPPQSIPPPPEPQSNPPPPPSERVISMAQSSAPPLEHHPALPPSESEPLPLVQEVNQPPEMIPPQPDTVSPPPESILSAPQTIPPPPPPASEAPPAPSPPTVDAGLPSPAQEMPPPPSLPNSPQVDLQPAIDTPENIPLPPALPEQAPANVKDQPENRSQEQQSQSQTSPPAPEEAPSPLVTPSPLQMVKLSPEPPTAQDQDQAQPEVTMRVQQPRVPTPSASGEAPQKPIRRSLIMASLPAADKSEPTVVPPTSSATVVPPTSSSTLVPPTSSSTVVPPISLSTVVPSTSLSTVTSPTNKSPPAMATSPSMNLQEAIRLRTAARTKGGPSSHLSLQSPKSPRGGDIHKSPSSTASFIFSKSTKKVVIETTSSPEAQANFQQNLAAELSSVSKAAKEADSHKTGVNKVPPPVAKKPKAKAKDMESNEETEQLKTAGQDTQLESIEGCAEKPNGSVEGQVSST